MLEPEYHFTMPSCSALAGAPPVPLLASFRSQGPAAGILHGRLICLKLGGVLRSCNTAGGTAVPKWGRLGFDICKTQQGG